MMIITFSCFQLFSDPSIYHHQQNVLAQISDTIFKTYENSTYGIFMQYPSDWKNVESGQFSQTNNFNIIVGFLPPKESASSRFHPQLLA